MAGLAMRSKCQRCASGLRLDDLAFICSYECTFCPACFEIVEHTCPNCGGELMRRPRRTVTIDVAACPVVEGAG